jgi:NAD(P)-dependent dehydrogenase (short-subunit alcohol dehydrogenase family)
MDLQGQQVVVLGGGSGIGLAVARQALARGAAVTIAGRSETRLRAAAEELGAVATVALDVTDPALVQELFAGLPRVDHVYFAAGGTQLSNILEGDVEAQLAPLMTKLWGAVHVIRAAVPRMASGGSLTFTGGLSTDRPVQGAWVSGVATAAAEQLARVMALELAPLRVNAVSPGYTDTPMWDGVLGAAKRDVLDGVAARLPVRRIATPDEVAAAVLLLMSNRSMTGAVIHVDGGARLV